MSKNVLLLMWLLFFSCNPTPSKLPEIQLGRLDLQSLDSSKDIIPLHGEWEFYPGQFLPVEENASSSSNTSDTIEKVFLTVPGNWNSLYPDGFGFGTYRAKVLLPETWNFPIALKISDQGTAYRLFVNGKQLAENGKVGSDIQSGIPHSEPLVTDSFDHTGELEIVFHVSNFHFREGGLWYPIYIGKESSLIEVRNKSLHLDIFLFGAISIIGVYHLFLYIIRKKDPSPLWFSLVYFVLQ